ncbi:MAG TPA: C1 family peptidase [Kofleriaceae bacterium]|jgi:hypothetical protein
MRLLALLAPILLASVHTGCVATSEDDSHEMLDVSQMQEDVVGDPYAGELKADAPLPASVDHSSRFLPARNQGKRGTCQTFALLGAMEVFLDTKQYLSVEDFLDNHTLPELVLFYNFRFAGDPVALEKDWGYNQPKPANIDQKPHYLIPHMVKVGVTDHDKVERYLASSPTNNILVGLAWDDDMRTGNVFDNPMLSPVQALWARTAGCVTEASNCGGHVILLVGYEKRKDSDGVTRTFYKFRNSWGAQWGESGYGWMSSEYLRQMGKSGLLLTK